MKLNKESLVRFSLDLAQKSKKEFTRIQFTNRLNIKIPTLNLYLTSLSNKGFLIRKKMKFHYTRINHIKITKEGNQKIN